MLWIEQMNISAFPLAGTGAQPAPQHMPDMRPAADAAALNRTSEPLLPVAALPVAALPVPPTATQAGAVNRAMLGASPATEGKASDPMPPVDKAARTLKPYGITMLPDDSSRSQETGHGATPDDAESTPDAMA